MSDDASGMRGDFVLNADVELTPVSAFSPEMRRSLGGTETDVVLSRLRGRVTSERITRATAELLEVFRAPHAIAAGVLAYARKTGTDPQTILARVGGLLSDFVDAEVLVPPDRAVAAPDLPARLADAFPDYTLLALLADSSDCAVARMRDANGSERVIKWQHGPAVGGGLDREVRAYAHLAERAPDLVARHRCLGRRGDGLALALDPLDGVTLAAWLANRQEMPARAALARALAGAYARLHAAEVLHGDIHPKNILIHVARDAAQNAAKDTALAVRLVDFGAAILAGDHPPGGRLGVQSYFEPEALMARRDGGAIAGSSAAGEQYGVATLIFEVVTGAPPLDLSLEQAESARQIIEEGPRPFAEFGLDWPPVEQVLRQALAKSSDARFSSMAEFAEALSDALAQAPRRVPPPPPSAPSSALADPLAEAWLPALATLEGWEAWFAEPGAAAAYDGMAGAALALLERGRTREDARLVAAADLWIERARLAGDWPHGWRPLHDLATPEGLLQRPLGLDLIQYRLAASTGESETAERCLSEIVAATRRAAARDPADPQAIIDVTGGQASVLAAIGMLLLGETAPTGPARGDLLVSGAALAAQIEPLLAAFAADPVAASGPRYLGFAHGVAGALFAVLLFRKASRRDPEPLDAAVLAGLIARSRVGGQGRFWPVEAGEAAPSDGWPGWCHGSAGHVLLFTAAFRVFAETAFLDVAREAARYALSGRERAGDSLCCGRIGIALALGELARVDARTAEDPALAELLASYGPDRKPAEQGVAGLGLFKGRGGRLLLPASDAERAAARFPLYSPTLFETPAG